jgi:alkylation response protein AidB-like acyl-CoA dehydrogenase
MASLTSEISTPCGSALPELCRDLAGRCPIEQDTALWPAEQLRRCGQAGVFRWFIPAEFGGWGWSDAEIAAGYVALAASCLTTTFVITQRSAAVRRIVTADSAEIRQTLLPELCSNRLFATVGISHLSTSRRHLSQPTLRAVLDDHSVRLDGSTAWVTGAIHADTLVIGAEIAGGGQLILAVDRRLEGVRCELPRRLIALTASCTAGVRFDQVAVDRRWIVSGPQLPWAEGNAGGGTGGLPTSALAIGLAAAAIDAIGQQAAARRSLASTYDALSGQWRERYRELIALARGDSSSTLSQLRAEANSLVLRSTQAALAAVKGAGFVDEHPVGRWCREALFFLVWSCPQGVVDANLCELAGIEETSE